MSDLDEIKGIDWASLFHLNQFAFAIWNCCSIYNVLVLSSVHSSWNTRIWSRRSNRGAAQRIAAEQLHGSMRKRKLRRVKRALEKQGIAETLANGCKNPTAPDHLYFFQVQKLRFGAEAGACPIVYPRLFQILSLSTHLQELSLTYAFEIGLKLLKNMSRGASGLQRLSLSHCGVGGTWFPILARFTKLKRFVLREPHDPYNDGPDTYIKSRITHPLLNAFYAACPDLHEVTLDTWALEEKFNFGFYCLQRFSAFQFFPRGVRFPVLQPLPNLKRLAVWGGAATSFFEPQAQFPQLTELHLHNMNFLLPQLSLLPNLRVLKLFGSYLLNYEDMQLYCFGELKQLRSLSLVGFSDSVKVVIRDWIEPSGVLDRLKTLEVLPFEEWEGAEELDDVLAALLKPRENQLTELCVSSGEIREIPPSKICKRFHSILYYSSVRDLKQRSRLLLN